MKEKEQWKNLLAVERDVPYEVHLKETQRLVLEMRPVFFRRYPLSFGGFMAKQIRFLAWKIWFLQGMVLALLCAVFFSIYGIRPDSIQGILPKMLANNGADVMTCGVPLEWAERFFARFLCGCSGVIAACAVPILRRSLRYRMFEVERATRFSVRGGLAAQLLFIGVGDAGMLAALALLSMRFGVGGRVVFLFGVIPFLTAAVSGLMLWMRREPCEAGILPLLLCGVSVWAAYEMVESVSRLMPDKVMVLGVSYALLCVGMIGWIYRNLFSQEKERELVWKSY
ncbi:MAG: hypothetical protein HDR27_05395 [Lachnospiraceae bacterium]|nr:hypothetical protein [Lachnospiraceae bacterium]